MWLAVNLLIVDEIDEFIQYLHGQPYRRGWNLSLWKKGQTTIQKTPLNLQRFIKPVEFHKWFGRFNERKNRSFTLINELMKTSQADSDEIYPIVKKFIRGCINQTIPNPKKDECPNKIVN